MTQGYNPRPRVVFPHALEVGVSSDDEVVEVELSEWVPPADFARRLDAALPEGLDVHEVSLMAPRRRGRAAVEARYEAELASCGDITEGAARAGAERFMESESWPVERVDREGASRQIDLRPHVLALSVEGTTLAMRLRLGRPGAARPREVVAAVLGRPGDPMLDIPLRKTKTVLAGPDG